jgi:hypothetical protein
LARAASETCQPERTCSVEGCDRAVAARGMCRKHYATWRNHRDPDTTTRSRKSQACSIPGCTNAHYGRGYCAKHWARWRRHGDPLAGASPQREPQVRLPYPSEMREKNPKNEVTRHVGCSVEGCERPHRARGYCAMHYVRVMKTGEPGSVNPAPGRRCRVNDPVCSVEDCGKPSRALGLCTSHYAKLRAYGDPTGTPTPRVKATCSVSGCVNPHAAKGYCAAHYSSWRKYGDPLAAMPRAARDYDDQGTPCVVEGCSGRAGVPGTARGMCSMHYARWQRTGNPLTTKTDLKRVNTVCTVDGCGKAAWARGLCGMHLHRLKATGTVGSPNPTTYPVSGLCSVEGCSRAVRHGRTSLCESHQRRLDLYGNPLAEAPPLRRRYCTVEGCHEHHLALGLCRRHYASLVVGPRRERALNDAPGEWTTERVRARMAYWGWRCYICGGEFEAVDHVKPLRRGGSNWPANLRPICRTCNSRKSDHWEGVANLADLSQAIRNREAPIRREGALPKVRDNLGHPGDAPRV